MNLPLRCNIAQNPQYYVYHPSGPCIPSRKKKVSTLSGNARSVCVLFERSEFLIPTWVTPQYRATSKKKICACVPLILVLVGGRQTAIVVARYDSMIPGTYYVPDTYIPGISRQKSVRTCLLYTSPSPRDKRQSRMPSSA